MLRVHKVNYKFINRFTRLDPCHCFDCGGLLPINFSPTFKNNLCCLFCGSLYDFNLLTEVNSSVCFDSQLFLNGKYRRSKTVENDHPDLFGGL